jgi:hypothetical protein
MNSIKFRIDQLHLIPGCTRSDCGPRILQLKFMIMFLQPRLFEVVETEKEKIRVQA